MQPGAPRRGELWWQLALTVAASAVYESLFLHHGLNQFDEGWPLYAAMHLHHGGTLYDDVFFVFPPGHLLSAWIAYALDPPGVVLARTIYAGFNVALCAALYLLGRRVMPPTAALFGALLLAVNAPYSHIAQLLFGYRYLVFPVIALLCLARRLAGGGRSWMIAAGLAAGVSLCFRLTPAFAVCCGVVAGVVASDRSPRRWLSELLAFGSGFAVAVLPVAAWLAQSVGLEAVYREAIARPVLMTDVQDLAIPPFAPPAIWERVEIAKAWEALQYRLWALLYLGYLAVLGVRWLRCLRAGRPSPDALLLAIVVFGGVFFLRTLGRSDIAHLESAMPPVCLLLAHLVNAGVSRLPLRGLGARRAVAATAWTAVFAAWILLPGVDELTRLERRGVHPVQTLGGRVAVETEFRAMILDRRITSLRQLTSPEDRILDMGFAPLFYVLAERLGPGHADIVVPGTFTDEAEEQAFVERLRAAPPAAVVIADEPFDHMAERSLGRFAPHVLRFVQENYEVLRPSMDYIIWTRRESAPPAEPTDRTGR